MKIQFGFPSIKKLPLFKETDKDKKVLAIQLKFTLDNLLLEYDR